MSGSIAEHLATLNEKDTLDLVKRRLNEGADPLAILEEAREGMKIVGDRFSKGTYFIPELIFSGEILKQVAALVTPHLKKGTGKQGTRREKVVVGTVAGDIHDIGKDMVVFMLDISGYDVLDLGIDVPKQKFVDAIKETGSKVVGLSGFLTLAFDSMKETIDSIRQAGLKVKVMIGGGQIDEQVMKYTGADGYGRDAMEAVKLANQWYGG
ncbi:MAG: cobalamin-dependent protein [Desulfobacterales bacterium]|nr:cobalamin-dependent protein [Desulfobacterales bacterium]